MDKKKRYNKYREGKVQRRKAKKGTKQGMQGKAQRQAKKDTKVDKE